MKDQFNDIFQVAGGNKPLQVTIDTMDVLLLALGIFVGMLTALIVFEGLKTLAK